jgi:hypothetical protein
MPSNNFFSASIEVDDIQLTEYELGNEHLDNILIPKSDFESENELDKLVYITGEKGKRYSIVMEPLIELTRENPISTSIYIDGVLVEKMTFTSKNISKIHGNRSSYEHIRPFIFNNMSLIEDPVTYNSRKINEIGLIKIEFYESKLVNTSITLTPSYFKVAPSLTKTCEMHEKEKKHISLSTLFGQKVQNHENPQGWVNAVRGTKLFTFKFRYHNNTQLELFGLVK